MDFVFQENHKNEKPKFHTETGLVPQWTLEAILAESDFTNIYLKNKNAPRKKPVSIEIRYATFFIILIAQNNNS